MNNSWFSKAKSSPGHSPHWSQSVSLTPDQFLQIHLHSMSLLPLLLLTLTHSDVAPKSPVTSYAKSGRRLMHYPPWPLDLAVLVFLPCSFSICFLVAISPLSPYKLGFLEFTLPECSHPPSGFRDHPQAQDFHISVSSSHLSCSSELPMVHPRLLMPQTWASSPGPLSPLPPLASFSHHLRLSPLSTLYISPHLHHHLQGLCLIAQLP